MYPLQLRVSNAESWMFIGLGIDSSADDIPFLSESTTRKRLVGKLNGLNNSRPHNHNSVSFDIPAHDLPHPKINSHTSCR